MFDGSNQILPILEQSSVCVFNFDVSIYIVFLQYMQYTKQFLFLPLNVWICFTTFIMSWNTWHYSAISRFRLQLHLFCRTFILPQKCKWLLGRLLGLLLTLSPPCVKVFYSFVINTLPSCTDAHLSTHLLPTVSSLPHLIISLEEGATAACQEIVMASQFH